MHTKTEDSVWLWCENMKTVSNKVFPEGKAVSTCKETLLSIVCTGLLSTQILIAYWHMDWNMNELSSQPNLNTKHACLWWSSQPTFCHWPLQELLGYDYLQRQKQIAFILDGFLQEGKTTLSPTCRSDIALCPDGVWTDAEAGKHFPPLLGSSSPPDVIYK